MPVPLSAAPGQALTARQAEVYRHIYETTRDTGVQPSIRDLMVRFEIGSPNGVANILAYIVGKGYIARDGLRHSRSLRFLRRPDGTPFTGFADKEPFDAD